MKKVLIFGSGSIGNHMAYACRRLSLDVFVTDIDIKALERMRYQIYPQRYKKWDNKIKQIQFKQIEKINVFFDLIIIGTPPETHFSIYDFCLKKIKFNKILIEKPLTNYKSRSLNLYKKKFLKKFIFCGYNHSVSKSFQFFLKKFSNEKKNVNSIIVDWCESWSGILNAHFWMKSPFESYLGNMQKGGGALQEHSHGLHLLILLLKKVGIDLITTNFKSDYICEAKGNLRYDIFSKLFGYKKKIYFNYNTDLFTFPAKKKITVKSNEKQIEWICNYKNGVDVVKVFRRGLLYYKKTFKKTRSSEFENQIKHILKIKTLKQQNNSNLNPYFAITTLKVIKKIFVNEK